MRRRLIIFDCDGTLVDSQNAICAAMEHAFTTLELPAPSRREMLGVVGLSLPQVFGALAGEQSQSVQDELIRLYRADFPSKRQGMQLHDPLFAGICEAVAMLAGRDDVVLGMATGKSRRGVARILEREGWVGHFLTIQTADDHPSKPHPSMILRAMAETGVERSFTVMVGDTTYDMEMARNAEVGAVGVAWGYHEPERLSLAGARAIAATGDQLIATIDACLEANV
jgi:phosphoglycolate phosphatase